MKLVIEIQEYQIAPPIEGSNSDKSRMYNVSFEGDLPRCASAICIANALSKAVLLKSECPAVSQIRFSAPQLAMAIGSSKRTPGCGLSDFLHQM